MQKAAHAYLQTQVTTTSQGDILVMLYDGAIKFLNNAKERLAANDMAGKGNYISKTLDIINELDSTLNIEKGGELAKNLHNLYFFCSSHLLKANLKKSATMIDEVLNILNGLRSAYSQILSMPEAQAAAAEAAANQRVTANQPARAQAGFTLGQEQTAQRTDAPSPAANAGARAHTLYAQKSAEIAPPQVAPVQPQSAAPQAAPPQASSEATRNAPESIPMPVSNARRLAGSDMYRKFAGQ